MNKLPGLLAAAIPCSAAGFVVYLIGRHVDGDDAAVGLGMLGGLLALLAVGGLMKLVGKFPTEAFATSWYCTWLGGFTCIGYFGLDLSGGGMVLMGAGSLLLAYYLLWPAAAALQAVLLKLPELDSNPGRGPTDSPGAGRGALTP